MSVPLTADRFHRGLVLSLLDRAKDGGLTVRRVLQIRKGKAAIAISPQLAIHT